MSEISGLKKEYIEKITTESTMLAFFKDFCRECIYYKEKEYNIVDYQVFTFFSPIVAFIFFTSAPYPFNRQIPIVLLFAWAICCFVLLISTLIQYFRKKNLAKTQQNIEALILETYPECYLTSKPKTVPVARTIHLLAVDKCISRQEIFEMYLQKYFSIDDKKIKGEEIK